ncbi:hypothetical protein PanWU01x14_223260 [Parasponia andersonii]|uniref:Uncharacterized protein n=1 Tax=Parasponia andersonii TaxID=3476 RepID=A0A2P5BNT4_PARAD|nr:hypothetical protein PanWU01x14_223260 [Parasponia andersonii]
METFYGSDVVGLDGERRGGLVQKLPMNRGRHCLIRSEIGTEENYGH